MGNLYLRNLHFIGWRDGKTWPKYNSYSKELNLFFISINMEFHMEYKDAIYEKEGCEGTKGCNKNNQAFYIFLFRTASEEDNDLKIL